MTVRRVLFACVQNSFRSQMAEGFARAYARAGTVDVRSGGTDPGARVHPEAVRLMAERGIDIAAHKPKAIDLRFAETADAFVSLCGPMDDRCPARIAKRAIDWNLPDPTAGSTADMRAVRNDIEDRVRRLLAGWNALRDDST